MAGGRERRGDAPRVALIELVAGLALFAAAAGSIYWVLTNGVTASSVADNFAQAQQNARVALDRLVEEAGWSDGVLAAAGSPMSVTFHVPAPNPLMANQDYQVTYALAADGTLQRTITPTGGASTTSSIASEITSAVLTFYDENNQPNALALSNAPQAYQIQATVTVTVGAQAQALTSAAYLRNKP